MAINLLKDYAKAVTAIGAVEGEGWLHYEQEIATADTPNSVPEVMETLERIGPGKANGIAVATIYGSGGYNRYLVYQDGTVKFSRRHAIGRQAIETAEREGIEIL